MNRKKFWDIIERCRNTDRKVVIDNLTSELKKLKPVDISLFCSYAGLYSYVETAEVYVACKIIKGYVSDDSLLYFTLWLVTQGREVYFGTLKNPDTLADIDININFTDFEELTMIGHMILDEMELDAETIIESIKEEGLADKYDIDLDEAREEIPESDKEFPENDDELRALAPKLAEKYGLLGFMERYSNQPKKEEEEYHEEDEYIEVSMYCNGITTVIAPNGKYGFVDKNKNIVIPAEYDYAEDFSTKLCKVGKNEKYGFINRKGEVIIPLIYDEFAYGYDFEKNMLGAKKDGLWGFINKEGMVIIPCKYEDTSLFSEGLASVCLNGKYAVIDIEGNLKTDFISEEKIYYKEGFASVCLNGKYAVIDIDGNLKTDFISNEEIEYAGGRAIVYRDDYIGLLDENAVDIKIKLLEPYPLGKVRVSSIRYKYSRGYEGEHYFSVGNYMEKDKCKIGICDRNGNIILPMIYDNMLIYDKKPQVDVCLNKEWFRINLQQPEILSSIKDPYEKKSK